MRIIGFFLALLGAMAALGMGFLWVWWFAGTPSEPVAFVVNKGENFVQLSRRLEQAGVIHNERAYRWYINLMAKSRVLKRGEYALARGMSVAAVVETLATGKVMEHRFTLPEGFNVFQIGQKLEAEGFGTAEAFLEAVRSPGLIKRIPTLVEGEILPISLEGYLFPDTYLLQKIYTSAEIAAIFLEHFEQQYALLKNEFSASPRLKVFKLSPHEAVILASIVEKETGAARERPIIASVFYNRLKKRMRLQSDPTTIYGVLMTRGGFDGNIRKRDLTDQNPYNTYTIAELPVGPISNPGLDALKAILYPAETDFLYFVSRNDGTSEFSVSYDQHRKHVDRLQKDPKAKEGKSWRDLPDAERANASQVR